MFVAAAAASALLVHSVLVGDRVATGRDIALLGMHTMEAVARAGELSRARSFTRRFDGNWSLFALSSVEAIDLSESSVRLTTRHCA